jgi:trigger factor
VKVEVEEVSSVKRKVHVRVPAKTVTQEFDKAYRELSKSARLKGFRPGKAPRSVLERYYGERVQYEVTTKLIQETYPKTLEEQSITPVSQPDIQDVEIKQGEDFQYTAVLEIKPQVEVTDYTGLEIEEKRITITKKKVQERLDEIREMFARLEDVTEDRPIQEGDMVLIEHRFQEDEASPDDRPPQEQMLDLRPERVEENLLKSLVGLKSGEEVDVPHTFDSNHPDADVAGRQGVLKVTVKSIQKKVLPKLDDDFAKRLGEYGSLEELRTKVHDDLEEGERQRIRSEQNDAMFDQLLAKHAFEVPEVMVEAQISQMVRNAQQRLSVHGVTLEQTGQSEEDLRAEFHDRAHKAVRSSLILEAIAKSEGIDAGDDDLESSYERIAERTGRPREEIDKVYQDEAALESLKMSIVEEKVLDFLRDKAKIKDKKKK